MKRILFILLLTIPFVGFGQTDFSVVPEKFDDYYYVSNSPKSLSNFKFRIPEEFHEFRDGRDNNVIKVFRKYDFSDRIDISGNKVNSSIIEFTITVIKWRDSPKYNMMLSMSDSEIKDLLIDNTNKQRDNNIDPNESTFFYEKDNLFWMITRTWSKEKNLYLIMSNLSTNKQMIQLSFLSNIKGNIDVDVKNIKKLIDSFEYIGEE